MYQGFYFSIFQNPHVGLCALLIHKEIYEKITEEDYSPSSQQEEDELFGYNLRSQLKEHGLYYVYDSIYASEFSSEKELDKLLKELGMEQNEWIAHPEFFNGLILSQIEKEKVKNILPYVAPWYYFHVVDSGECIEVHFTLKPIWDATNQATDVSHVALTKALKKLSMKEKSAEIYSISGNQSREEVFNILISNGFQLNIEYSSLIESAYGKN